MFIAETPAPKAAAGSSDGVKVNGRDIYFFNDVNPASVLALIDALRSADNATTALERRYKVPITLHINSYGGEVFSALSVIDHISLLESEVHSLIAGCACSAATLISMSCDKRYMLQSSVMLIHQLSSVMWGTYEQFKDEMKLLDMLMGIITEFYATRSKLKASDISEMLKRDTWMNAAEAVQSGFVDKIIAV
jgi:ATP-dependent Clp protease, protease subunit